MPLLDVVLSYDCNLACDYCTITPEMRARSLSTVQVVMAMRRAAREGYDRVSFTGGEPTIRHDLMPLVREAKRLGLRSIKVQTNGLLLTPRNLDSLMAAGVTSVGISVHTHERDAYEAMVQRQGVFDAMRDGLAAAAAARVDLEADLIMNRDTAHRLADAVRWVAERGVEVANLWLVSLTDGNRERVDSLLSMDELMPHVHRAFDVADEVGLTLHSLHLPHCVLGLRARHARDPAAGGVRLLTPDDERDLADAKLTPGSYVPACEGCPSRVDLGGSCRGLRPDYLEVHGDLAVAAARGVPSSISATRLPLVAGS